MVEVYRDYTQLKKSVNDYDERHTDLFFHMRCDAHTNQLLCLLKGITAFHNHIGKRSYPVKEI
ncbi:hypothetical protein JCM19046_1011 [Bacillus sp. JCM 19046]|nr:hypothetical protein JCM19046_1011 [Bacillus sp. JCM 19046]